MFSKKRYLNQRFKKELNKNNFMIFVQHLNINSADLFSLKKGLLEMNLRLKIWKGRPISKGLKDTRYSSVGSIFHGPMGVVYPAEDYDLFDLKNNLGRLKKEKKIQVLGGIFFDKLLNPSEIYTVGDLIATNSAYTELAHLLGRSSGLDCTNILTQLMEQPSNVLSQSIQNLISSLEQISSQED